MFFSKHKLYEPLLIKNMYFGIHDVYICNYKTCIFNNAKFYGYWPSHFSEWLLIYTPLKRGHTSSFQKICKKRRIDILRISDCLSFSTFLWLFHRRNRYKITNEEIHKILPLFLLKRFYPLYLYFSVKYSLYVHEKNCIHGWVYDHEKIRIKKIYRDIFKIIFG